MNDRKGQTGLNSLVPIILILVIASFTLILGLQLLGGFSDATDNYSNTLSSNETGGWLNATGYTLSSASTVPGFNSPQIVTIINGSSGVVLTSTNWTLTGNVLTNATAKVYQSINLTYSYSYGQNAYIASNKSIAGTAGLTDYWQLIVLAAVIGVIIGLILIFVPNKVKAA